MPLAIKDTTDGPWLCPACREPLPIGVFGTPQPCRACNGAVARAAAMPRGGGPGTELKSLLARIGIKASPTCSCTARATLMDSHEAREPGWCEANIDTIVGWLREEATKRRLPFVDAAGRALVRLACRRASKKQARNAIDR